MVPIYGANDVKIMTSANSDLILTLRCPDHAGMTPARKLLNLMEISGDLCSLTPGIRFVERKKNTNKIAFLFHRVNGAERVAYMNELYQQFNALSQAGHALGIVIPV